MVLALSQREGSHSHCAGGIKAHLSELNWCGGEGGGRGGRTTVPAVLLTTVLSGVCLYASLVSGEATGTICH